MNNWIVLLRGINVGGKNIVPMKQLASMLNVLGCENVQTYIQSGNVLLQHSESSSQVLSSQIAKQVELTFGFKPQILLLTLSEFRHAATNNPYPNAELDPKSLHLFFLATPAKDVNLSALNSLKKDSESFNLTEQIFYLHAPDGIGRSKLAEKAEKTIGVPCTGRNWNTVSKLLALAKVH